LDSSRHAGVFNQPDLYTSLFLLIIFIFGTVLACKCQQLPVDSVAALAVRLFATRLGTKVALIQGQKAD
jgi:hypothetical protein